MFQFILRRLTMVIPTFVGVSILTFSLIHMIPGNPVTVMGGERGFSAEQTAEITAMLGLDKPLWQQYFVYVGNVLQGNLGTSFITREPVLDEFLTLFPATIELSFFAALFALSIGLPLGIIAAYTTTFPNKIGHGTTLGRSVRTLRVPTKMLWGPGCKIYN